MSSTPESITDIARAIQLALAPAFLLTGIAGRLNVMTGRLARIIDRGRALSESRPGDAATGLHRREMQSLEKRRHLTSVAITACTIAALLLCMVIASLAYFLREVHMATGTIRIRPPAGNVDGRGDTS